MGVRPSAQSSVGRRPIVDGREPEEFDRSVGSGSRVPLGFRAVRTAAEKVFDARRAGPGVPVGVAGSSGLAPAPPAAGRNSGE